MCGSLWRYQVIAKISVVNGGKLAQRELNDRAERRKRFEII